MLFYYFVCEFCTQFKRCFIFLFLEQMKLNIVSKRIRVYSNFNAV